MEEKLEDLISACINKAVCGKIRIIKNLTDPYFNADYISNNLIISFMSGDNTAQIRVYYCGKNVFLAEDQIRLKSPINEKCKNFPKISKKIPPINAKRTFTICNYIPGLWESDLFESPGYECPNRLP